MLSLIPVVGIVFKWVGTSVCWFLQQPPDVVINVSKTTCGWVFGGNCS